MFVQLSHMLCTSDTGSAVLCESNSVSKVFFLRIFCKYFMLHKIHELSQGRVVCGARIK